jgi:hypothetical protein
LPQSPVLALFVPSVCLDVQFVLCQMYLLSLLCHIIVHLTSISLSQTTAFMWIDLHYQDARSQLSGMTASSTPFSVPHKKSGS